MRILSEDYPQFFKKKMRTKKSDFVYFLSSSKKNNQRL